MERQGGKEKTGKQRPVTCCVYSLHVCDTFYRYRLKTVVERWDDVDTTVHRSFSRLLKMGEGNGKQDVTPLSAVLRRSVLKLGKLAPKRSQTSLQTGYNMHFWICELSL